MKDAKIHSKRGVWYVTRPGHDVQRFESEEDAMAFVEGKDHITPIAANDDKWADFV